MLVAADVFDAAATDATALDRDTRHHLTTVLRLRDGADLELCDGAGRVAPARLRGDRDVEVTGPAAHHARPEPPVTVVQATAKGRKVDEVVRVLTEAGVDALWAVNSARSVSRPDGERAARAVDRWRSVAAAACAQARRPWLPEVQGPDDVPTVAARIAAQQRTGIVAHVGTSRPVREVLDGLGTPSNGLLAAIGPEGGWTDGEVRTFEQAGLTAAHLGPAVLRTEHAGVVAATCLAYHLHRLG